jgi:hypothetical protein
VRSLAELERDWTINMIADAHHWLDEFDRADDVARKQQEQKGDT